MADGAEAQRLSTRPRGACGAEADRIPEDFRAVWGDRFVDFGAGGTIRFEVETA